MFVALVAFTTVAGIRGLRAIALRIIVSVAGITLLLAPTLLAQLRFSQFYDPQTKNTLNYKISQQFVNFGSYFYDGTHRWLALNGHDFVQIDFAIWVPIAAALAAVAVGWMLARNRRRRWTLPRHLDLPVIAYLVTSLAVYLVLQLSISYGVYRLLTPLLVINFPWRMLAFITPIGIVLVVVIADEFMRRHPIKILWRAVACIWLASLVVLSPITSSLAFELRVTRGARSVPRDGVVHSSDVCELPDLQWVLQWTLWQRCSLQCISSKGLSRPRVAK